MNDKTDFIQDYIDRCDTASTNAEAEKLVNEIVSVFNKDIAGLTDGLDSYNQLKLFQALNGRPQTTDYLGDVRLLKQKLTWYKLSL